MGGGVLDVSVWFEIEETRRYLEISTTTSVKHIIGITVLGIILWGLRVFYMKTDQIVTQPI